jgi:hypothetical protein
MVSWVCAEPKDIFPSNASSYVFLMVVVSLYKFPDGARTKELSLPCDGHSSMHHPSETQT